MPTAGFAGKYRYGEFLIDRINNIWSHVKDEGARLVKPFKFKTIRKGMQRGFVERPNPLGWDIVTIDYECFQTNVKGTPSSRTYGADFALYAAGVRWVPLVWNDNYRRLKEEFIDNFLKEHGNTGDKVPGGLYNKALEAW
jgi:hypothetical protein